MEGTEESSDTVPALSNEQVTQFLVSKGAGLPKCALCGHAEWSVMEGERDRGFPLHTDDGNGGIGPRNFPVTALACANCGYTLFLARMAILGWLDESKNGK